MVTVLALVALTPKWIWGQFDRATGLWQPGHFDNEEVPRPRGARQEEEWRERYGRLDADGSVHVPASNVEFRLDEAEGRHRRGNRLKIRWGALKVNQHTVDTVGSAAELGIGVATGDPLRIAGNLRGRGSHRAGKGIEGDRESWLIDRLEAQNAFVESADGRYLGSFSKTEDPAAWLGDRHGRRGGPDAFGSLFNEEGPYGSLASELSCNSPSAPRPPKIMVFDVRNRPAMVGMVTANPSLSQPGFRLHPAAILEWQARRR